MMTNSPTAAFLTRQFQARQLNNSRFSLRAFARLLGVQPSFLSYVMRGKRKLSDEMALNFSRQLGLSKKESDFFETLVRFDRTKNGLLKGKLLKQLTADHQFKTKADLMDLSEFSVLSNWYYFVLLSVADAPNVKIDFHDFSKQLGLSLSEVRTAFQQLERSGLIQFSQDGEIRKLKKRVLVQSSTEQSVLRQFHVDMFQKSIQSLQNCKAEERYPGNDTLALNAEEFEKAKKILEKCAEALIRMSCSQKSGKQIYQLSFNLFPILKLKSTEAKEQ